MQSTNDVEQRIARAALELFVPHGIKKTTVEEVAQAAGVTRVTIYRHFAGKAQLVRAAFMVLMTELEDACRVSLQTPDLHLESLIESLSHKRFEFSPEQIMPRWDELKRLYASIYEELHALRLSVLSNIFDQFLEIAEQTGRLREGLDREVVRTILWEVVMTVLESKRLRALELSPRKLHQTIQEIFLYGILKP